jgi:hypothetical protein
MSALNWIRDKADHKGTQFVYVSRNKADEGVKPGLWRVDIWQFIGVLNPNMVRGVKQAKLEKSEGEFIRVNETLKIGAQCEFSKTLYEWMRD